MATSESSNQREFEIGDEAEDDKKNKLALIMIQASLRLSISVLSNKTKRVENTLVNFFNSWRFDPKRQIPD